MFIAIALDLIATPMVIETANSPEELVVKLREWCIQEKGSTLGQDDPVFEKQVIDACYLEFANFTEIASRGLPAVRVPGGGDTITIVVQRYDEES